MDLLCMIIQCCSYSIICVLEYGSSAAESARRVDVQAKCGENNASDQPNAKAVGGSDNGVPMTQSGSVDNIKFPC